MQLGSSYKVPVWKYTGTWPMLAENTGVISATGTKYGVPILLDDANNLLPQTP